MQLAAGPTCFARIGTPRLGSPERAARCATAPRSHLRAQIATGLPPARPPGGVRRASSHRALDVSRSARFLPLACVLPELLPASEARSLRPGSAAAEAGSASSARRPETFPAAGGGK